MVMIKNQYTKQEFINTPIGQLPLDWEVENISSIFDFIPTNSFSRSQLNYEYHDDSIYNIHYGDIHAAFKEPMLDFERIYNIPVLTNSAINNNSHFLKDGDLVIADASEDYAGVGEAIELYNLKSKKVVAGLHTFALRDKKGKTANGFRTYLLKHPKVAIAIKVIATGTKVYGISKSNFAFINVPLPPLLEQQKIAEILSTWDEAIRITQKTIAELKKRNKGLAQQLLTGKKRLEGFKNTDEIKITRLGLEIPKDWRIVSIGDVFKERNEKSSDLKNYPLYSLTIEEGVTEKTERYERSFLLRDSSNNMYKIAQKDDIVFNPMNLRFGAIAKSNIDFHVTLSAYYNVIYSNSDIINIRFFERLFKTERFIDLYERIAIGSLIEKKRVHLSNFFKLKVGTPPIKEQNAITEILDNADQELKLLEQKLETLQLQKKGLMQKLLTGKIRVNP